MRGLPKQPWRAWMAAARPQTLPAGVMPVVLASALAAREQAFLPHVMVLAALGAVAIQVGTNLYNDYADFVRGADTPERLGPARMTQQGQLRPAQVRALACAAFFLAAVCGLGLIAQGGWPIIAVGLCSIAAGFLYTGGPYPLAYHGLGDLFVFVFFGLVATVATYALHTGTTSPVAYALGAALGLLATAILVVNNLRDRFTDAQAHKRTLAVRLGAKAARVQYAVCVALPFLISAALSFGLPEQVGRPYVLGLIPWAAGLIRRVAREDGAALNPLLGYTARLEAAYVAVMSLTLLFGS